MSGPTYSFSATSLPPAAQCYDRDRGLHPFETIHRPYFPHSSARWQEGQRIGTLSPLLLSLLPLHPTLFTPVRLGVRTSAIEAQGKAPDTIFPSLRNLPLRPPARQFPLRRWVPSPSFARTAQRAKSPASPLPPPRQFRPYQPPFFLPHTSLHRSNAHSDQFSCDGDRLRCGQTANIDPAAAKG